MLSQLSYVPMTDKGHYSARAGKMQALFSPSSHAISRKFPQDIRRNLRGGEVILPCEIVGVVAVEECLRQSVGQDAYVPRARIEGCHLLPKAAREDAVLECEDEAVFPAQ